MKKILFLLLAACGSAPASVPDEAELGQSRQALSCPNVPTMSSATLHFTVCGADRTVREDTPQQINASLPVQLYVGKHGLNGTSNTIAAKNAWYCLGYQQVAIYPQGVHQGPPQNGVGWDALAGGCDEQFNDAAIAYEMSRFPTMRTAVREYGFSMGSLQSVKEVLDHPRGWADFLGVVSGEVPWTEGQPYPTIAVDLFQDGGALDTTFPIANQQALRDLFLSNDGGYFSTNPGYDSTFTCYGVPSPYAVEFGVQPNQGHGWYSDTSPALDDFIQRRLGL